MMWRNILSFMNFYNSNYKGRANSRNWIETEIKTN